MWICIGILGALWIFLLIPVVQERRVWIAFAHGGTAVFFTSLLLNLGFPQTGDLADILWLQITGFVLCIPAAFLFGSAIAAIARGNLVRTGIMRIIRHPMYLGTAIASFALILIFQSLLSIALFVTAAILLWIASKKEDDYNLERFGDSYREHMSLVPRWNFFKGVRNR
jgi:protein-S-isoprenylcysteine O-methyltransferase Ste14